LRSWRLPPPRGASEFDAFKLVAKSATVELVSFRLQR
jgi:hypothetical protein